MGLTIWACVLCLQASLLSHALDCTGTTQGEGCVSGYTASRQFDVPKHERAAVSPGYLRREDLSPMRRKRQLDRRGPTHLSHPNVPGAVSVKGFPNTLIQTERSRRHLGPKKTKRKSRVGSFSLLSNKKPTAPLQVTRARRQVSGEPGKKGKSGRSGAYSILGDPQSEGQTDRPKRSVRLGAATRRARY